MTSVLPAGRIRIEIDAAHADLIGRRTAAYEIDMQLRDEREAGVEDGKETGERDTIVRIVDDLLRFIGGTQAVTVTEIVERLGGFVDELEHGVVAKDLADRIEDLLASRRADAEAWAAAENARIAGAPEDVVIVLDRHDVETGA